MSWFSRSKSSNSNPQSAHTHQSEAERLRGRQLAGILRVGGKATNRQQTKFDILIPLNNQRQQLFLQLFLPDNFPFAAPVVQTSCAVSHPWVDRNCIISHRDLNNWNPHADLGRILSEMINEFVKNPPIFTGNINMKPETSPSPYAHPSKTPPAYNQPFSNYPSQQRNDQSQYPYQQYKNDQMQKIAIHSAAGTPSTLGASPPYAMNSTTNQQPVRQKSLTQTPSVPDVFPELEELSTSQLERIVNDRSALKHFVRKMDSVVNFLKLHDELVDGNVSMAKSNMAHESEIDELQSEIAVLRCKLQESQEKLAKKQSEQQSTLTLYKPESLVKKVANAAKESDEKTEEIADQFTSNGNISTFLEDYLEERKLYHLRIAKVTRFSTR